MKRETFNPFTPVRESKFGKKRSMRSQKSRKLDMGHSTPSTAASIWPTTVTTTMVNLSVPSGLPSTSSKPSMPKQPVHRLPYKMWAIHHPTPVPFSSPVHSDWSSGENWDGTNQKERERE